MASSPASRLRAAGRISFVVLMLMLTGLFVSLGVWQLQRLGEKEALVAAVETRLTEAPIAFPPAAQWPGLVPEALDYRNAELTGTFDGARTVLVFTNLPEPRGQYGRAGYWVMAPLETGEGGIVWINRGFVPEHLAPAWADGGWRSRAKCGSRASSASPSGPMPSPPAPDYAARREWVRDPERLSDVAGIEGVPVAPITIDLPAGAPENCRRAGKRRLLFPTGILNMPERGSSLPSSPP